jgi:hypothetical protein
VRVIVGVEHVRTVVAGVVITAFGKEIFSVMI